MVTRHEAREWIAGFGVVPAVLDHARPSRRARLTRDGVLSAVSWCYLAVWVVLSIWFLMSSTGAQTLPLLAAAGTLTAVVAGPRLHRPASRRAWNLIALATVLWLVGAALRGQVVGRAPLLSDVVTMTGYLSALAGCLELLRRRGVVRHTGALLDGLVLGTSATLLMWCFNIEPLLHGVPVSPRQLAFNVVYPVIDILLLLILAQLSFTDASRTPSYWVFALSMVGVLVGDLFWNLAAVGRDVSADVVTAPYLLAYAALAASMLHPSMVRLTSAQPVRDVLPPPRVIVLAIALAGPTALAALVPGTSLLDRLLVGFAGLGLSLLVLLRTARATNAFARAAERFEHSALHDELTGLPNRRFLMQSLKASVAAGPGRMTVVFFLDLDAFKLINDSWGHEVGDELLVQAAMRLSSTVRDEGLVARIGGDEFVVTVTLDGAQGTDPHDVVRRVGARLIDAFTAPFQISPGEVFASPSIGVSWYLSPTRDGATGRTADQAQDGSADGDRVPEAQETAVELLRDADIAMYEAKSHGRGRLAAFDVSLRQRVRDRLELETALRKALETGELRLAYQPLIDLETRRLVGWEALARWERPGLGPVSPAEFIPVAEHTGLIIPLGDWAIREAIGQLDAWRRMLTARGLGAQTATLCMSVNVSIRQLSDVSLGERISRELGRHGLPPSALRVEITESGLLDDAPDRTATINDLRARGISIAVDDFGTGYSALGYLNRFPFSTVKIDRSFVAGLETSADDTAIVRAVIAMAHALGLDLVAEGVETEGQAAVLRELGCRIGQGYLLARPALVPEATEQLLARLDEWVGVPQAVR